MPFVITVCKHKEHKEIQREEIRQLLSVSFRGSLKKNKLKHGTHGKTRNRTARNSLVFQLLQQSLDPVELVEREVFDDVGKFLAGVAA